MCGFVLHRETVINLYTSTSIRRRTQVSYRQILELYDSGIGVRPCLMVILSVGILVLDSHDSCSIYAFSIRVSSCVIG